MTEAGLLLTWKPELLVEYPHPILDTATLLASLRYKWNFEATSLAWATIVRNSGGEAQP